MGSTADVSARRRPSCCGGFINFSNPNQTPDRDWYRSVTPKRALKLVQKNADAKVYHPMQEHVLALAFEEIAKLVVTESGWKLVAPHVQSLLESAILPALRFKEQDRLDWQDNEDEYLQKHLPPILEDSGDHLTPRRSALKVLGLISMYKKPAVLSQKQRSQNIDETLGESLIMPTLLQIPLPQSCSSTISESASNYFATLMAYGGLKQFLKMQSPDVVTMIIHARVIPVFTSPASTPYMMATASWLIGILVNCLPKILNKDVYGGLMNTLLMPNRGELSWRPVRAASARTILILLQEMYIPISWLPLLKGSVSGARMLDMQGALLCFQLLSAFTEAGGPSIARHIPSISSSVEVEMARHLTKHPGAWPQIIREGFSILASFAHIWDASELLKENGGQKWQNWKASCAMVACSFSRVLECAWLPPLPNGQSTRPSPPSICLNDASVLLATVIKYTGNQKEMEVLKVDSLLQAWAELVASWKAWESKEDMAVFEVIDEAVSLQKRCTLPLLAKRAVSRQKLSAGFPTLVTMEGIFRFICSAMEAGFNAAASRACRRTHPLLYACKIPQATLEKVINKITQGAIKRLKQSKRTLTMALAKSLILVIASCFLHLPCSVEAALTERNSSTHTNIKNGFLRWGEAMAVLAETENTGLCLQSELKLAVITLLKLASHLSDSKEKYSTEGTQLARHCALSVLEAMSRLKQLEVKKQEEEEESCDQDDNEETWVGRSEQYRQYRREQLSRELQKEAGWSLEDEHELDLGIVGLINEEGAVRAAFHRYGSVWLNKELLTHNAVVKFVHNYPTHSHLFFNLIQ